MANDSILAERKTAMTSSTCSQVSFRSRPQASRPSIISYLLSVPKELLRPNSPLQPRRLRIAPAAAGCKRWLAGVSRESVEVNLKMPPDLAHRNDFVAVRVDERTLDFEFPDLGRHQAELGEFDSVAGVVRPAVDV